MFLAEIMVKWGTNCESECLHRPIKERATHLLSRPCSKQAHYEQYLRRQDQTWIRINHRKR